MLHLLTEYYYIVMSKILNIPIAEIREDEHYSKLLYHISNDEYKR